MVSGTCKIGINSDHVLQEFRFYTGDQIYRQRQVKNILKSAYSRVPCVVKACATGSGGVVPTVGVLREGSLVRELDETWG